MSEKRFQLNIGDDYCFINDKIENKTYAIYNDRFKERWGQEIVDLLNELYEENNQLRKDKAQLKERLRECRIKMR